MNIVENSVVEMHFELKNGEGKLLDSSEGQEPLLYMHGKNQMLPALEKQLEGKAAGDKLNAVITPEEGYGRRVDEAVMDVDIAEFGEGADEQIHVGLQFIAQGDEGDRLATVVARDGDKVTIDLNHPLADEELHFDINVVSVREATEEELSHGHVHAHGDSCNH